jgi:FKBP-type peptidyl-prolyl cis-trans isomerase SlyD
VVEQALDGKSAGESCRVRLEPDDAFGEYDAELVHVEPRDKFPNNVGVGMQFEGRSGTTDEMLIYTVTDIAEDKVVVDGNHPLAGQTLDFACTVSAVRSATDEEVRHGHVHGPHGHHH